MKCYINPYLNYGIILWGNTYKNILHKLVILQKKAIRIITGANYNDHCSPLYNICDVLKVNDLYSFNICKLVYDFIKSELPSSLNNIYIYNRDFHVYQTRNRGDVCMPLVNSALARNSFLCKGPEIWTSLPVHIKYANTTNLFKRKLRQHYLVNY